MKLAGEMCNLYCWEFCRGNRVEGGKMGLLDDGTDLKPMMLNGYRCHKYFVYFLLNL